MWEEIQEKPLKRCTTPMQIALSLKPLITVKIKALLKFFQAGGYRK